MKTLSFKGFGFKNDIEVSFRIKVDETTSKAKVALEIFCSDLDFEAAKESYQNCNSDNWTQVKIIKFTSLCDILMDENSDYVIGLGSFGYYVAETDESPYSWSKDEALLVFCFQTIEETVVCIREIVSLIRNYWKAQKGDYNKLVASLRSLKLEDLLPEDAEGEITISHSFKRK